MAERNRNNSYSGAIGNLVYREVGNKQIVQLKPDSIRQTKRTKESGSEFRQCSSWSKWLRLRMHSFLEKNVDHYMFSRFAGRFYTVLQTNIDLPKGERTPLNSDMGALAGFDFNTNSPFADYFMPGIAATLTDQNEVTVTIPSFNPKVEMQFAKGTRYAELLVYVMTASFESNTGFTDDYTILPMQNMAYTLPETVWTSTPLPEGQLVLVCAKVLYYNTNRFTEKHYVNSKECSPATIVMVGKVE